ncbi:hypothetical protein N309_08932, partial [Tinamus guttatus]
KAVLHNILKLLSLGQLLQQGLFQFLICIQFLRKATFLADWLVFLPQGLRGIFQPVDEMGPVFQGGTFQNFDVFGAFVELNALLLGRYVLGVHK